MNNEITDSSNVEFFLPQPGYQEVSLEVIGSKSMAPFFRLGDQILVHEVPIEEIERGDIIVFSINDRVWAHRVIDLEICHEERVLIVKPDAYAQRDPTITRELYIGRVVASSREGTSLNLRTHFWRNIFLVIALGSRFQHTLFKRCTFVPRMLRKKVLEKVGQALLYLHAWLASVMYRK